LLASLADTNDNAGAGWVTSEGRFSRRKFLRADIVTFVGGGDATATGKEFNIKAIGGGKW
jgi:hypothetical protein